MPAHREHLLSHLFRHPPADRGRLGRCPRRRAIDVRNPATGETIGRVARAGIPDLDRPLATAQAGLDAWRRTSAHDRSAVMRRAAVQQLVIEEPVGPVAVLTPWNFPINQVVRKLGAALATRCSFLVKAPEETPAAPAALLQAFVDAGIPAGTVGLVFGDPSEISSDLIASPIIRKVTFTGSTPSGKELAALAGLHGPGTPRQPT